MPSAKPVPSNLSPVLGLAGRTAPVLLIVALLGAWELLCGLTHIPEFLLPAPSAIAKAVASIAPGRWAEHILATVLVSLAGFAFAMLFAIPAAILFVRSRFLSRLVFPLLVVVQATPIVAIAPLLIVTFGTGPLSRVLITVAITFFPLVVSASTGMQSTPVELIELSRSLRAPASREIWQIRMPYALPHLFSGMKVAITLSVIGAVVAEFVASERGLGYLVQYSTSSFNIPATYGALIVLAMVSLFLYKTVEFLQNHFLKWSVI